MYVRFHSPWAEVRRGVHYGLFGPSYRFARDMRVPEVLRIALWQEIEWFEQNLRVPPWQVFCVKSKKRWRNAGICWFADGAREAIARAFCLAALLHECGVPVTKIATHAPGQILYRDALQIVAKPGPSTPTVWH